MLYCHPGLGVHDGCFKTFANKLFLSKLLYIIKLAYVELQQYKQ